MENQKRESPGSESLIHLEGVKKHFKVLNRREGLGGAFLDLFSRDYRYVKAVDGINLDIARGEIVGFLGPNGAGKSTTIKMMTGVLTPTEGSIVINGMNPFKERVKFVRGIGVVFGQRTQLWWELPVRESFKLLKEIFGIPDDVYRRNLSRFEELVNLKDLYGQQVRNLSLGQRMLCDIAASFLHDPSIIFLDEPTIGLDVAVKGQIRRLIRSLNEEKKTTILLTTHDIGDIEALCRRIVMIDKGRIIYDGATESFNKLFGSYRTLKVLCREGETETMNRLLPGIRDAFDISAIETGEADTLWYDITIDQEKTNLSDVLSWSLNTLPVKDVKIQEIRTESVIAKVYAGGIS
jgi:ABC-2 type transport system ATP-binding protein